MHSGAALTPLTLSHFRLNLACAPAVLRRAADRGFSAGFSFLLVRSFRTSGTGCRTRGFSRNCEPALEWRANYDRGPVLLSPIWDIPSRKILISGVPLGRRTQPGHGSDKQERTQTLRTLRTARPDTARTATDRAGRDMKSRSGASSPKRVRIS